MEELIDIYQYILVFRSSINSSFFAQNSHEILSVYLRVLHFKQRCHASLMANSHLSALMSITKQKAHTQQQKTESIFKTIETMPFWQNRHRMLQMSHFSQFHLSIYDISFSRM